jgi:PadR family transcriptional regulator, regulatory protein PadR
MDSLPLAPRDLLILSVLAASPLHGYGIIKAVEERSESGVLLDPANLYRCLRRMRTDGWIDEVAEEEGDARRRTYRVTAAGRRILRLEVARLERLLSQVGPALGGGTS